MQRIHRASMCVAMVAIVTGILASSASAFPNYSFSFSFGSKGSGSGQFNSPEGMTTDAAGNVYVADRFNNRIQKFNSKGEFQKEFGNSKLGLPTDVAIDSKGNFWVTQELDNESIHKVVKFNSNGEYLSTFGPFGAGTGEFWNPERIDIDSKDNMWISDPGNNRLQEFNAEGKFLRQITKANVPGGEFVAGGSIAIDSKDNVWVVDRASEDLLGFNSEGKYVGKVNIGEFSLPVNGLAIDAKDRTWVAASDETGDYLLVFNTSGEMLGQVGELAPEEMFFQPQDLGFDPSGNPWVRELSPPTIQKWLPLPDATTKAATDVGLETTLNGGVNPNGVSTTYRFEWGETAAYGKTMLPKAVGSGTTEVAAIKTIGALAKETSYHYRLVATSEAGTTYGQDMTFYTGVPAKNISPPVVSPSTPTKGVPATTTDGIWTGEPAPTFTYRWQRCTEGTKEACTFWVTISGATSSTYTPVEADVGYPIRSVVTGRNGTGVEIVKSGFTNPVKP